jgi:hypothetical protein
MISLVRGGEFRTLSSKKSGELATQKPEKSGNKNRDDKLPFKIALFEFDAQQGCQFFGTSFRENIPNDHKSHKTYRMAVK